jgi:hypothetical protein
MELTTRLYIPDEDYPLIAGWWTSRTGTTPPKDLLPDDFGLIAQHEGRDLAAVFAYYHRGNPFGFLGWTVSTPETWAMGYSHHGVRLVIKEALARLKAAGVRYTMSHTDVPAVMAAYQHNGMRPGSRECLTDFVIKL